MVKMKIQLLVLFMAVGFSFQKQCLWGDASTAETNYDAGTTIKLNKEECQKIICNEDGEIKVIHPVGSLQTDCCICDGNLFIPSSDTCITKVNTGVCPGSCLINGISVKHSEIVEDLDDCAKHTCMDGLHDTTYPYGVHSKGCCKNTKKNKDMKAPNSIMEEGRCVSRYCKNGAWVPHQSTTDARCKTCKVYDDPHFNDFAGILFDWHDGCNYALVQEGRGTEPEFGVFMDFNRAPNSAIGVVGGPTTYQENKETKVELDPKNLNELKVNGATKAVTSTTPKLLDGTETVYAWKTPSCIRLYGKNNILVELCGYQVTIWATWEIKSPFLRNLEGLCGSPKPARIAAVKVVDRYEKEHTVATNIWSPDVSEQFGKSWKANEQTKPGCLTRRSRKPSVREAQSENIRKGCVDVSNSPNHEKCRKVAEDAGLTGDEGNNTFNACLFDLCIAVTDPWAPFTEEEMLERLNEIAINTKSHLDNTIEFVPDNIKCPFGWSPVGGQCYQVYEFKEALSLDDVKNQCISDKATLAHPIDVTAFNNYILRTFPKGPYWLGGRSIKGGVFEWLVGGGKIPIDRLMIGKPLENTNEPNNCLELEENHRESKARVIDFTNTGAKDLKDKVIEEPSNTLIKQLKTSQHAPDHPKKRKNSININIQVVVGNIYEKPYKGTTGTTKGTTIGPIDKQTTTTLGTTIEPKQTSTTSRTTVIETTEKQATTSEAPDNCIDPEFYICEREPLACGDEDYNCAWRAADGDCEGNRPYMYNVCKESCNVPCECQQPDTCTTVGGMCQPLDAICDVVSDPTLCSGDACTCCHVPDPCQDTDSDHECADYVSEGYCESTDEDILNIVKEHCSRSCRFCDPIY